MLVITEKLTVVKLVKKSVLFHIMKVYYDEDDFYEMLHCEVS
jgi:hypothetical protein